MKKNNIIKTSLLCGVLVAVASCKEENYYIMDPNGVPQASDYNIKVQVDDATNQVTLSLTDAAGNDAKGVYPVWKVYTKSNPVISTRPVYTDIVAAPGDYEVEMQVGNRNGLSDGVRTATFHIENQLADFSSYIRIFTDGESKVWQMAANEPAHLACGEPGTDGTGWWSAQPYEKSDFGIYDNHMIFADNGSTDGGLYTFDPGTAGTVYINTGITNLPPYSDYWQDSDYCAPVDKQEDRAFSFSVEGVDFFLNLPEGTFLAYLPNVDQYNTPKWKINSFNRNKIELTCSNSDIAWHYILQPEGADAGDKPFEGFKYDSEFNLWKDAPLTLAQTWFADAGWNEIASPDVELSNERIFLHTPAGMGNDQWQGQVKIYTGITVSADKTYDFSMCLNAPVDCDITVKPHLDGDDGVFFVADKQHFEAGGSYYYFSDVPGFDGVVELVLDFGGYPDTDFEITKIVLKDHANDDGTVLPTEKPEDPADENVDWVDVDSPANLYNQIAGDAEVHFWYAPGWNQIADPELTREGNKSFSFTLPEATSDQWQAQFNYKTGITIDPEKFYDVKCTVVCSQDFNGVTFKLTHEQLKADGSGETEDIGELVLAREAVEAFEEHTFKFVNKPGIATDNLKVVFDFGGNPANTNVIIKDIVIQEHQAPPTADWVDFDSDENLMKKIAGEAEVHFWYAPGWNQIADPELTREGNKTFSFTLPQATSDQWQAQFNFKTGITIDPEKFYDVKCTVNCDQDFDGVTFKLTHEQLKADGSGDTEDIGELVLARDKVEAFDDHVFSFIKVPGIPTDNLKVVFDFGGNPDNTKVVIKDIIIQEHK